MKIAIRTQKKNHRKNITNFIIFFTSIYIISPIECANPLLNSEHQAKDLISFESSSLNKINDPFIYFDAFFACFKLQDLITKSFNEQSGIFLQNPYIKKQKLFCLDVACSLNKLSANLTYLHGKKLRESFRSKIEKAVESIIQHILFEKLEKGVDIDSTFLDFFKYDLVKSCLIIEVIAKSLHNPTKPTITPRRMKNTSTSLCLGSEALVEIDEDTMPKPYPRSLRKSASTECTKSMKNQQAVSPAFQQHEQQNRCDLITSCQPRTNLRMPDQPKSNQHSAQHVKDKLDRSRPKRQAPCVPINLKSSQSLKSIDQQEQLITSEKPKKTNLNRPERPKLPAVASRMCRSDNSPKKNN